MMKGDIVVERILEKHKDILIKKLRDNIIHAYFNTTAEIDNNISLKNKVYTQPRIDLFIYFVFKYTFYKLNKGDKLKAYELINELQTEILDL